MSEQVTDPILIALSRAVDAIEELDEPNERWQVAAYLALRYGVTDKPTALASP